MFGNGSLGVMEILVVIGVLSAIALFVVPWCIIFHKARVPWGFFFIPVFGTYKMYEIADSTGLFLGRSRYPSRPIC